MGLQAGPAHMRVAAHQRSRRWRSHRTKVSPSGVTANDVEPVEEVVGPE